MDKKKLIGTIIGVVAFGALMVGATFALLSYNIVFNNANYNFSSANFSIVYGKGTTISKVPTFDSTPSKDDFIDTGDDATGGHLSVTARTVAGSLPGLITIYLYTENTTTAALIASGAINYAVCLGNTEISATPYKGTLPTTGVIGNKYNLTTIQGSAVADEPLKITSSSVDKTYNIYFWIDPSKIDDNFPDSATYSGYIGAKAEQLHQ